MSDNTKSNEFAFIISVVERREVLTLKTFSEIIKPQKHLLLLKW